MNGRDSPFAIPENLSVYRSDSPSSNVSNDSNEGSEDSFQYAASIVAPSEPAGSTNSKKKDGLPFHIEKQLVVDIQADRGLDQCNLARICKAKPDLYGGYSVEFSKEQKKRRQQVAQHSPVLEKTWTPIVQPPRPFLPVQHATATAEPPLACSQQPISCSQQSISAFSTCSHAASSHAPHATFAARRLAPPAVRPEPEPQPQPIRPFAPLPAGLIMNATLQGYLAAAVLVQANTGQPENNMKVKIYRMTDHELPNGRLADGWIVEAQDYDPRWMTGENPALEFFHVGANETLLKLPSGSYTSIHEPGVEVAGLQLAGVTDDRVTQPMAVHRNAVIATPNRQYEIYRILFPDNIDNAVFSPGTENGKVEPKVVPVVSTYDVTAIDEHGVETQREVSSTRVNVLWKIAQDQLPVRAVTAAAAPGNELAGQMSSLFGRM